MPGTEELMARLSQLEQGYYGDKEAARQKSFFDTYGSRFSNNRGLGLAILNELDARGIDTSAADEAVQEILDTLRVECNQILDLLKGAQEAAIQNAQKVETIANVVSQQVASNPEASITPDGTGLETPPIPDTSTVDGLDDNGEFDPDMVAAEEGGEEVPPEGGEVPLEEPPVPPAEGGEEVPPENEEELPPDETLSDERLKNKKPEQKKTPNDKPNTTPKGPALSREDRINKMTNSWNETRTQRKRAQEEANKNSCISDARMKRLIAAASRGY